MAAKTGARFIARVRRGVKRRLRGALRRLLLITARLAARLHPAPRPGERPRVRILLQNAYGMGGTTRTVLNLAGHLGDRYDVEIVSMMRRVDEAFYDLPRNVTVTTLRDERSAPSGRVAKLLARVPSMLTPPNDGSYQYMKLAHDLRLVRLMGGRQPDVLIGTRPSLNLLIAETGRPGVVTIAQDHTNLRSYGPPVQKLIRAAYGRLDALAVLTESSLAEYEQALGGGRLRIVRIPNAVPPLAGGLSPRTDKVVLAAGRYVHAKGFDLLIQAYEPVAAKHPDWTLKI